MSRELLNRLLLDAPAATLSWLGRQGTRAVAALIVIGIAIPPIGALLKPFVTEAVFVLLCIAFLRVDAAAFKIYLRRPAIVLAATAWTSLVIPALFSASYLAFGLAGNQRSPGTGDTVTVTLKNVFSEDFTLSAFDPFTTSSYCRDTEDFSWQSDQGRKLIHSVCY